MEEKKQCIKKDTAFNCSTCNYFSCPYLTEQEKTTVYHYEEWQAELL